MSAWRGRNSRRYAESVTYKGLGYDVIGMTNMPEAKLAREAEITYATVAMVTDFDCWHPGPRRVDVASVMQWRTNTEKAERSSPASHEISRASAKSARRIGPGARRRHHDGAVATRDPGLLAKLDAVAGRVLAGLRAFSSRSGYRFA